MSAILFYIQVAWPIIGLGLSLYLINSKEFDKSAERMSMYAGRRAYALFTVVVCILLWPVVVVYMIKKDDDPESV